jgi:hypothetical protein
MPIEIDQLIELPNGRSEYPATLTVNKMGKSVVLNLQIKMTLDPSKAIENPIKRDIISVESEINS